MSNEREKWIDNAKGISILLVIIGHVSGGLSGIWKFDFVYGIHLTMFFILSGFTIKRKKITLELLNKKFEHLMIPYFLTCIAVLITDVINNYLISDTSIETISKIIGADLTRSFFGSGAITNFGDVELGTRIGAIWFLPAIFFATFFFQLILNYYENRDDISGILSALIAAFGYISARFMWLPFSVQSGMMATFFIWIGYEIKKKKIIFQLKWYHYIIAQLILLLGINTGYCNIGFVVAYINDWIISTLVGISGCILIYLISIKYKGKILEYVGRKSLLVLCVHLYTLETMGVHFNHLLDEYSLQGNTRAWVLIIIEILFTVGLTMIIDLSIGFLKQININFFNQKYNTSRDTTIDVLRGILIIMMLIGHFSINNNLRIIIYSCHMIAFIFFSGYFYNTSRGYSSNLKTMIKNFLKPYIVFIFLDIILNFNNWNTSYLKESLVRYLLGMSFSKSILKGIASIGPVYFVLLLFVVRFIYVFIAEIKNEWGQWIAVLCISLFGYALGKMGYWLPWSVDVAMYCIIFYKLGLYFNKSGLIKFIKENSCIYFLLSPIWGYMIYIGGMEIATRNYGQYGITIIGSIMGVLTIYIFAEYINRNVFIIKELLGIFGKESIIILILHTLVDGKIKNIVSLRFDSNHFTFMFLVILIQLSLAMMFIFGKRIIKNINEKFIFYGK